MRIRLVLARIFLPVLLALACAGLVTGCEKSDAGKAVQKTMDDLTGKSQVQAEGMLKKQINNMEDYQVEKVQRESGRPAGEDVGEQDKDD